MNKEKRIAFAFILASLIVLLITSVLSVSLVSALAENNSVTKAYTCLKGKIGDKCDEETLEEKAFSLLALGSYKNCLDKFNADSSSQECWPKSTCNLKDTALALLVYDRLGKDTEKIEKWLSKQNTTTQDLIWFLEIDSEEASSCEISYSGGTGTIGIRTDKKVSGSVGTCLKVAGNGYWFEIGSSCLDEEFSISCDKDFITALLYKLKTSSTIYVSSETHSDSASGKTTEKVSSFCFKQGNSCNYEGSLWAALALDSQNIEIKKYLPYLTAFASDNDKYFPDAFLHILTGDTEYLTKIINSRQGKLWNKASKYYDTALAILSIGDSSEADEAKTYLLANQDSSGCWAGIRDTAFLLWTAWPNEVAGDGGTTEEADCEDYEHFCELEADCEEAGGEVLENFNCFGVEKCCSVEFKEKKCEEQEGVLCAEDEVCPGDEISSSDYATCCTEQCEEEVITPTTENKCEKAKYVCRSSCEDNEEETTENCEFSGDICCKPKRNFMWIIILAILIVLVALGLLFKDRLKMLLFKRKTGFREGPSPAATRPSFYPPGGMRPMVRRPVFSPSSPYRPIQRTAGKTDKELDETLRKLKEMSK